MFIDKYFFILTLILNAFFWFMVFIWLLFASMIRMKWALDKRMVEDLTEGQDLAIYYIKEARKFIQELNRTKLYGDREKDRMEMTIENLTS